MARLFAGSTADYLSIPDGGATDVATSGLGTRGFVVSVWVNVPSVTAGTGVIRRVIAKSVGASTGRQYEIGIFDDGRVFWDIGDTTGRNLVNTAAAAITANQWIHLCGVFSRVGLPGPSITSDLTLYVNGAVGAASSYSTAVGDHKDMTDTAFPLIIGDYHDHNTPYTGLIAEVALWGTTAFPNAAGIDALAKGFSPLFLLRSTLLGYWPLKQPGSTLPDIRRGADATVNGTVTDNGEHPRIFMPGAAQYTT